MVGLNNVLRGKGKKISLRDKDNKIDKSKSNQKAKKKDQKKLTFTKIAICFVLINSEIQIWASYILAFLGREAIAEALSQQIVITIIGTMVGYFVKSLVENLSKYTTMFGTNLDFHENQMMDGINAENCNDEIQAEFDNTQFCDGVTPIDTNEIL